MSIAKSIAKLWKSKFLKIARFFLVFVLVFSWLLSGWPQIWKNPPIPPEIQVAQAAVSYVTYSSAVGKTATCTITKPTGLAVNDLMIAHLVWEAEGTGISGPSGWVAVGSEDRVSTGVMRSKLMYKIAVQADVDATSFAFTNSTLAQHVCAISVFWGYDLTAPINASNGQVNAASATVTSAGITPTVANTMILMFASISDDNTQSTYAITTNNPASWLEAYDVKDLTGTDAATAMGYATRPETTATGNGTAVSSASDINIGHLVAIKPAVAPTVSTQAATNKEATTATCNGTITATGGANSTNAGCEWDMDTGAPYANTASTAGDYGAAPFTQSLTGLPAGTTIYARAFATNSGGTGYGGEVSFLTKPAAPTGVAATDGTYTDKVTITWTKPTGATNYNVWRDSTDLGAAGDVATFDDTGAAAPTITPGSAVASDGTSTAQVDLSLSGASANNGTTYTYKVVASNATGNSVDSATNTGYRGVGSLTYQWQRSALDSDASYSDISGATTATYSDTAAPAPTVTAGTASATDGSATDKVTLSINGASANVGAGRYYQAILNATGAAQQTSASNRGYRGVGSLTYQWNRSSGDADSGYSILSGATTAPYDDTTAPAPTITAGTAAASDGTSVSYVALSVSGQSANSGAGRYFYATVSAAGASSQDTTHDRGYIGVGSLTYQWQRSALDSDASYSDISGATTASYNDTGAPADGSGRYFKVVENATGATQQISTADRGYRTAAVVSVSVSDGVITYGTMVAGASKTTIDLTDTQTLTNDGNVTEIFNIKGQDTACPWTLLSSAGTDQYVHQFCKKSDVSCASPPTNYTALTTSYQTLYTGVAAAGTRQLDLRVTVPTTSSCFTSQAINVTIQATQ